MRTYSGWQNSFIGMILAIIPFLLTLQSFVVPDRATAQQKRMAITMDDGPFNAMRKWDFAEQKRLNEKLLGHIKTLGTPVAAFFNGSGVEYPKEERAERIALFRQWLDEPLITPGNHTYSHEDHGKSSRKDFIHDVHSLDRLFKSVAPDKPIQYFRFPYNALGKDSADQGAKAAIVRDFGKMNYTVAPFTIESADYVFALLYDHELTLGNALRADSIAQWYINYTMEVIRIMEHQTRELHGRDISHIFLCHANALHAACYPKLIERLKGDGYDFITLDEALRDSVYQNRNYYHGTYGISWLYRWISRKDIRQRYQRNVPDPPKTLYQEYMMLQNAR